ncbi:helix-turn-helix transcriptional regulator [Mangrovibacillus sp. Mu-81]|uniref:helix-turn-helix domain-containing protein n=1 Tax=Mangrovibacillus sp. Mu-81 TaxID=3121478 RepID=UPI002FE49880
MSSNLFRFIRQSRGLTQKKLSEMLGISEPMVCMIERGKKNVIEVNKKLRELFGNEYVDKCRTFLEEN